MKVLRRAFFALAVLALCVNRTWVQAGTLKESMNESKQGLQLLSLSHAVELAIQHNHDVKLSKLAVESAEAATTAANKAPNPALTVQMANINPQQGIGSGAWHEKAVDTTVRIDQLIERGKKRGLRTESALYFEKAAQNDLAEAQRQLGLSVSQAYYDLVAAQEKLKINHETVTLFEKTINAAQKRKKAGDLAGADVARLQVDALRAKNDDRQAQADVLKAQQSLAYLLGIDNNGQLIKASDDWPAIQVFNPLQIDIVLDKRPDVQAAKNRLEAASAGRDMALALRSRDVSVGVQFEHWPTNTTNQQGTGNSYGVSVQVPLFVNNYYDGEIRAALVAVEVARENLEKVKSAARTEMQHALEDVSASADQVKRFQEALLLAAKQSAESAEFAFKNGALSVMDVLDARRVYKATQLDSTMAQANYAKALEAWRAASVLENSFSKNSSEDQTK